MAEETEGTSAGATEAAPATTSGTGSTGNTTTVETGTAATSTGNTAQAFDWNSAPPPDVSAKFGGAKTWKDVTDRYGNSSREAQRLNQQYTDAQRKLEIFEIANKVNPKQPQADQNPFFGFKDQAHYLSELERDPVGTKQKENAWMLEKNAELIDKRVNEIVEKKLAPFQQQSVAQREKSLHDAAVQTYPEIAEGGPLRSVVETWVEENQPAWQALKDAAKNSNINPWKIAADAALAGIHRGQAEALRGAQKTTQGKAGTATAGPGVKGAPDKSDIASLAQQARANGEEVPDHVEKAMELAFNRPKRNERRKP